MISIGFYLNYFLLLFFATGVGFQLPLALLFLNHIGLVEYHFLRKGRKFAVLIILIVSAALTPPDFISQVILGIPLYFLYELSLIAILIFNRKNKSGF